MIVGSRAFLATQADLNVLNGQSLAQVMPLANECGQRETHHHLTNMGMKSQPALQICQILIF